MFKHTQDKFPDLIRNSTTIDKGHGRLETRSIEVISTDKTILTFPGVQQVARLHRIREVLKYNKKSEETVYLFTNIPFSDLNEHQFLQLHRSYWAIENKLHYRKDFTFGEDRSTIRAKDGPQNMATLRNFAIGLMLRNKIDNVKRCVENLQHDPYSLIRLAA